MRSERGSTLVETLVALVILGVGVLPVIGLMGAGYRYQGRARLDVQIATLAEAKMEELIAIAGTDLPDTLALNFGGSVEQDVTGHWDVVQLEDKTFTRRWRVQPGPAGARDVTLRVLPRQPAAARAIEVSTQIVHE